MRSFVPTAGSVERQWHVIDAEGKVLGRVATEAARLLQGKHKAIYTPYIDTGDHVVIVNAARVKLTGRKEEQKLYRYHSGYEGGVREERVEGRAREAADPHRGRSRARHAAEDQDGRSDVAQAEGLRGRQASARGAEAGGEDDQYQERGRITWQQQSSITAPDGARHRRPASSSGPAPAR